MRRELCAMVAMPTLAWAAFCSAADKEEPRWVHSLCQALKATSNGPFVELADGGLLTIDKTGMRTSKDDAVTWSEGTTVCPGIAGGPPGRQEPGAFYVVRARNGTLVAIYLDFTTYKFRWDDRTNEPIDCCLEIWAIRSLDGGKTWTDRQRILEGYNPNFFGFIQTKSGRLIAAVPHLVPSPGRYVACSLFSDDDGKTWKRSNLIDLGGHGHHSGAMEPSVAELGDGRLMMLIRTHWGRFWEAYSDDDGLSWRTVLPCQIESTSAPGYLLKLASGRLALVCNDKTGRKDLLLYFSEDDGKNWTPAVVIARQKDGQISYPFMMERRPGELWITAGFAPTPLRLKVDESLLLAEAKKTPR